MALGTSIFFHTVTGVVAACATSFVVLNGVAEPVSTGDGGAQVVDVSEALNDLRENVSALEKRIAASASPDLEAAGGPREVDVEALVRRLLAEKGAKVEVGVSESGDAGDESARALAGDAKKLAQGILEAGIDSEEAREIWQELEREDRLDEALDIFRAGVSSEPTSAAKRFELARAAHAAAMSRPNHKNGRWWTESDDAYTKTLELDPDMHEARYRKAANLTFWPASFGRMPEAIRHFEVLTTRDLPQVHAGSQRRAFVKLGNIYAQQGDEAKAAEIWARGMKRFPGSADLRAKLNSIQR